MSNKLNILVAYPYMRKDVIEILNQNKNNIRFLLDSGAFTAWKAKKEINLDDYCRFIESLPFEPWKYFSLDVIGDAKKSMDNYELMLKRGFKPIPIFTRGEDPSVIEDYYKTSEVVGLGGLVGTTGNKGFVKGIMKKVNGRKVHWLGFTNKMFLKIYKPYMCDSSSLTMSGRYGQFELFDKKNGNWTKLSKKDFVNKPEKKILDLICSYNFKVEDFSKEENWREPVGLSSEISFQSHVRAQGLYFKKLSTLYFVAPIGSVTQPHFNRILKAHKREGENEINNNS